MARLLSTRRKSNSLRALEDLLARADRIRDVSVQQVNELTERYGVDFGRRFLGARRNLYRRYFEHCLDDRALSADESEELTHLRNLLQLGSQDVMDLHDEVGHEIYGAAIDEVLADHRLDPDESEFLTRLRKELGLSEGAAERLYQEGEQRSKQRFLERAASHDHVFVAPRERTLELSGASHTSLEDAVRRAIQEACQAVPELCRFDVTEIRGEVASGGVTSWQVTLKAGMNPQE
jgi:flavin-binding protein dodecin